MPSLDTMKYGTVLLERKGRTALLRLHRPDSLNAYTPDMGEDLVAAFRETAEDADIDAVILTGDGRAFCAGADRAFLRGERGRSGLALGEESFVRDFAVELARHPKLTIAAFNGVAVGIGVTMTLSFDIRIAAPAALLKLNFAELGILPGLGASFMLPRLIGLGAAKKLLLCDRQLSADQACALGLLEQVAPTNDVVAAACTLAERVHGCPLAVIAAFKRLLNEGAEAVTLADAVVREQAEARALAAALRGER